MKIDLWSKSGLFTLKVVAVLGVMCIALMGISPTWGDTSHRIATKVVAAYDSTADGKTNADYVCDGTADQMEIQAAIDTLPAGGGKVVLLEGQFNISSPIILRAREEGPQYKKNYVVLEGVGQSTRIYLVSGSNCNMIEYEDNPTLVARATIRDMFLHGNRDGNTSGSGIVFHRTTGVQIELFVTIENVTVGWCADCGIYIGDDNSWSIVAFLNNIFIPRTGSHGLYFKHFAGIMAEGIITSGAGGDGIFLDNCTENMFTNCAFDVGFGNGIHLVNTNKTHFRNGYVGGTMLNGIKVEGACDGSSISGYTFNGTGLGSIDASGVRLNNTYHFRVTDNTIWQWQGNGFPVQVLGSSHSLIIENNDVSIYGQSPFDVEVACPNTGRPVQNMFLDCHASSNTHVHAPITGTGKEQTITTEITNPNVPRTLKVVYNSSGKAPKGLVRIKGTTVRGTTIYDRVKRPVKSALSYRVSDGSYLDETTTANNGTVDDMHFMRGPDLNDAYYIGSEFPVGSLSMRVSTKKVGNFGLTWEYWDGSKWATLPGVTGEWMSADTIYDWSDCWRVISWKVPSNWTLTTVKNIPAYWLRIRVSSFNNCTTAPLGSMVQLTDYSSRGIRQEGAAFWFAGTGTLESAVPFATVSSIIIPESFGPDESISVGIGDRLGLSQPIISKNHVYKVTKNSADATIGTVDVFNGTVDCAPITEGDDFTIYYNSSFNQVE